MNFSIVIRVLGILMIIEAILMIPSLIISIITAGSDLYGFLIAMAISLGLGFILSRVKTQNKSISARDGLAIVSLGWLIFSLMGAIPIYIGDITISFIDAFFESVSGFTATGASVLADVEALPKGIVFWRSFSHWIGGMGILVFTVALLPALGIGGFQIYKAESPGPMAGKIVPRIKDTAKLLYIIYFSLTILNVFFLFIGGMDLFDSVLYAFSTVGTGGFATKNNSIAYYESSYIHLTLAIFMILAGINFSLYYYLIKRRFSDFLKDEELRLYLGIILFSTLAIGLNLYLTDYGNMRLSMRDSFFHVSSIISTTGFTTLDFEQWPSFSRCILIILMFIGGSAGSTAGGLKVARILLMFKVIKRGIIRIFHPRAIIPVKSSGKLVNDETISGVYSFLSLYIIIFISAILIISLEGVELSNAASTVLATLGNIGIGKGYSGFTSEFAVFSPFTKLFLSILMLLGRLELFTIIALFAPKHWRGEL